MKIRERSTNDCSSATVGRRHPFLFPTVNNLQNWLTLFREISMDGPRVRDRLCLAHTRPVSRSSTASLLKLLKITNRTFAASVGLHAGGAK